MIKKRIIFTFYFCDGYFVQSRNFSLQKVGNIEWIKKNFDLKKISNFIDEVAIINLSTKGYFEEYKYALKQLSEYFFIPIIAGGRILKFKDVQDYFSSGCDKVILNTNIFKNPKLINEISSTYGSQSIVASIDLKKEKEKYFIYVENGKNKIKLDPKKILRKLLKMQIGEIMIRSIDKDGSGQGLEYKLIDLLPDTQIKNLILAGGCGNIKHIQDGLSKKKVNAVCTGNLFNFINEELKNTRINLLKKNFILPQWNYKETRKYKNILI